MCGKNTPLGLIILLVIVISAVVFKASQENDFANADRTQQTAQDLTIPVHSTQSTSSGWKIHPDGANIYNYNMSGIKGEVDIHIIPKKDQTNASITIKPKLIIKGPQVAKPFIIANSQRINVTPSDGSRGFYLKRCNKAWGDI